ncbi:MAG: RidA family protein [Ginsengibacter sp.]
MKRQVNTGTPWEDIGGYCRAVRVGNIIEVAGTTAMDGDTLIGKNDIETQTRFIFNKIKKALEELDAGMENVVRTRMFVTNMDHSEKIVRIHGEFFAKIKPVSSLIEISRLINDEMLIEIETTAIVP